MDVLRTGGLESEEICRNVKPISLSESWSFLDC
jgi:hypothetical protein